MKYINNEKHQLVLTINSPFDPFPSTLSHQKLNTIVDEAICFEDVLVSFYKAMKLHSKSIELLGKAYVYKNELETDPSKDYIKHMKTLSKLYTELTQLLKETGAGVIKDVKITTEDKEMILTITYEYLVVTLLDFIKKAENFFRSAGNTKPITGTRETYLNLIRDESYTFLSGFSNGILHINPDKILEKLLMTNGSKMNISTIIATAAFIKSRYDISKVLQAYNDDGINTSRNSLHLVFGKVTDAYTQALNNPKYEHYIKFITRSKSDESFELSYDDKSMEDVKLNISHLINELDVFEPTVNNRFAGTVILNAEATLYKNEHLLTSLIKYKDVEQHYEKYLKKGIDPEGDIVTSEDTMLPSTFMNLVHTLLNINIATLISMDLEKRLDKNKSEPIVLNRDILTPEFLKEQPGAYEDIVHYSLIVPMLAKATKLGYFYKRVVTMINTLTLLRIILDTDKPMSN